MAPYKNKEDHNQYNRNYRRTERHGNWRQIAIDNGFMCVYPVDELPCGELDNLQFHERFGEATDGRMQQRVLLCVDHHNLAHEDFYNIGPADFYNTSHLTEDLISEQAQYSSTEEWAAKFDLDLSRFGILWGIEESQGLLELPRR